MVKLADWRSYDSRMGKKNKTKKGKGAEKTAQKTDKKADKKVKKILKAKGEVIQVSG